MNRQARSIVIPGGNGYLGRYLAAFFSERGDRVTVLSRRPQEWRGPGACLGWDGATPGDWARAIDGADAVINLTGRSVNCRYNAANRRAILESRLRSTHVLGAAIAAAARPPRVWLNASSATIYRHAIDRPMDEASGEIGSGFSVDVCRRWEQALFESPTPGTRKVALRAAMVFGGGHGGVMEPFRAIVRCGLGGPMAGGQQYISWIHLDDFARSLAWLLEHDDLDGPVNIAAPEPRTNTEFLRVLRTICGQPIGLPTARWMLEIGAALLRTETELLLKSRRVIPARLLESGFRFRYPRLYDALHAIVNQETTIRDRAFTGPCDIFPDNRLPLE